MNVPVLIVGGGPTGLSSSILLSRMGVPSLLVERHPTTSIFPKASGISTRSMELFREWGIDDRIRSFALDLDVKNSVSNTLIEPEVARRSLGYPTEEEMELLSPTYPAVCPQDFLEPILLNYARRSDIAELRFNEELTELEQHDFGVTAKLRTRGTGRVSTVSARYVIAADGASSPTRQLVGVGMNGKGSTRDYLTILFHANLSELVRDRRCALYTITHPDITGVIVPTSEDNRWVLGTPCNLQVDPEITRDIERLTTKIRVGTGVSDLAVEIMSASTFGIAAQVADRFRERSVFLAGDAAHRMTPSGGMGMNTGIQDAHNLTWKIAAVYHGWAGADILGSYEAERRIVAERNVAKSIGMFQDISGVAIDLGSVYRSSAVYSSTASSDLPIEDPSSAAGVGRRVPHAWVDRFGRRRSLLDLAGDRLVMIGGPRGAAWCHNAEFIAQETGIPMATLVFDSATAGPDAEALWHQLFGLHSEGAVLVRPDGHIAWCANDIIENTVPILSAVFAHVLSKSDHVARLLRPTVHQRAIARPRVSALYSRTVPAKSFGNK